MSVVGRRPRVAASRRQQTSPVVGLADPFPDEREMFALAFSSHGFGVEFLPEEVKAAVAAVRDHRPGVVVSRIVPGDFGIDLVTRIRADEGLRRVPVILLTSYAIPKWQTAGRDAGADAVLLLPVFVETLCALAWQLAQRR